MDKSYLYSKIRLNEGAYFFKQGTTKIKRNTICELFANVSDECKTLAKVIRKKENTNMPHYKEALCSLLIVKSTSLPSFLGTENESENIKRQLTETKLGYLLIVEIDKYVVIIKKNVVHVSSFINKLETIDAKALAGSLVTDSTVFQQIKMTNMSVNENGMRNKSYEANNLKNAMPTFASNHNIVTTTRFSTDNDICTLNISTSRMAKFGKDKKNIGELLEWIDEITYSIDTYQEHTTFLSKFAKPISWKLQGEKLTPNSLLIDVFSLQNYINTLDENSIYKKDSSKNPEYEVLPEDTIKEWFEKVRTLPLNYVEEGGNKRWMHQIGIGLSKTRTRLSIVGDDYWNNLYVKNKDKKGYSQLLKILNAKAFFTVSFDSCEYIYTGGRLYMNANIKEDFDAILSIMSPIKGIDSVSSEKGTYDKKEPITITNFSQNCMFHVVENEIYQDADYLVCDDLGNEWADHIAIKDDTISFIHSKCKDKAGLSASAFQEIVGQATKNIGNLDPSDKELDNKKKPWDGKSWGKTSIPIMRKGTAEAFVNAFKELRVKPNRVKEICLAVNFISQSELKEAFKKMKEGQPFRQKNTIIQMVWLLNAFISSCKEADLHCKIYCKD